MELKECKCCGEKTLDPAIKFYDICPVCGWQDDPIQNEDQNYEGGANHISLIVAKRAVAEGKPLRPLKKAAVKRHQDMVKRARAIAESIGEEFYEGETYKYLEMEEVAAHNVPVVYDV